MRAALRRFYSAYPELLLVVVAAIIGLGVQRPLAWLASHQGINVLLAILVFATALTIEPAALRRMTQSWRRLLAVLVAGITVLPALAWAASRLVAAGSLRDGVLAVGVAPCEIASVATTGMAGGEAALSAGVLIGSTVAAVAVAGPLLSIEVGHAHVHTGGIIVNLVLVVALPLAVGILLRTFTPIGTRFDRVATTTATVSVAALVALIAAEVHLSGRYFAVVAALVLFLVGSAIVGRLFGIGAGPPTAVAVLLTMSMRDFAIAAGLATTAFGPAAAAPLGLYGILVLVWGTAVAGLVRKQSDRA